jgi:hypothetical protein
LCSETSFIGVIKQNGKSENELEKIEIKSISHKVLPPSPKYDYHSYSGFKSYNNSKPRIGGRGAMNVQA